MNNNKDEKEFEKLNKVSEADNKNVDGSAADAENSVVPAQDGEVKDVAEITEDDAAAALEEAKKKKRKVVDRVITAALVCVIVACVVNIGLILWR